jgi:hypothetical protein
VSFISRQVECVNQNLFRICGLCIWASGERFQHLLSCRYINFTVSHCCTFTSTTADQSENSLPVSPNFCHY